MPHPIPLHDVLLTVYSGWSYLEVTVSRSRPAGPRYTAPPSTLLTIYIGSTHLTATLCLSCGVLKILLSNFTLTRVPLA